MHDPSLNMNFDYLFPTEDNVLLQELPFFHVDTSAIWSHSILPIKSTDVKSSVVGESIILEAENIGHVLNAEHAVCMPVDDNVHVSTPISLKFGLINCRSMNNKGFLLHEVFNDNMLDAMALTETWLSPDNILNEHIISDVIELNVTDFIHKPRSTRGGGVGLLYSTSYSITEVPMSAYKSFELIVCRLKFTSQCLFIYVIYRPPCQHDACVTFESFLSEFNVLLSNINTTHCNSPFIITGDLNIHFDNHSCPSVIKFNSLLECYGLKQYVSVCTHSAGHSLDCVIADEESNLISEIKTAYLSFSDHLAVFCNLCLPQTKKSMTRQYRNTKDINYMDLRSDIEQGFLTITNDWSDLCPSVCVQAYNKTLQNIFDAHAPIQTRSIKRKRSSPWITPAIFDAKRKRRSLERQWRKHKDLPSVYHKYKDSCHFVDDLINRAKTKYFTDKIHHATEIKAVYSVSKSLMGLKQCQRFPDNFTDYQLANNFATYFVDKVNTIHKSIEDTFVHDCNCDTYIKSQVSINQCTFDSFSPTSVFEVKTIISKMSNATCDLDPLSTTLVKSNIDILAAPICEIINLSFQCGQFPSALKHAIITPILKKSNLPLELSNYRPIANLSFLSKVVEKIAFHRLNTYLVTNNLLDPFQSAYSNSCSTETALLKVSSDINAFLDDSRICLLVMLDLSSAFDTIKHDRLLSCLRETYHVSGNALDWIDSYLVNRTFQIKVNQSLSDSHKIFSGVPQGSILGPLLFKLYMAPLSQIPPNFSIYRHFYADDTQIYTSFDPQDFKDEITCIQNLENCLTAMYCWLSNNFLKCNNSKTELLMIGSKHNLRIKPSISIHFANCTVRSTTKVKNLGCIFDSTMSNDQFVTAKVQSCNYFLRKISSIRKYLTVDVAKIMVNAFITSRLDYCNSLLFNTSQHNVKRLQIVQNNCARLIFKIGRRDHISLYLYELHWLPVELRVIFKLCTIIFKCITCNNPPYLSSAIHLYIPSRNLRSSTQQNLIVPRFCNSYGKRTFNYMSSYLWNSLPPHIKLCNSMTVFKKLLKTYLFTS